jgi:ferrous iron transport protein A
MKSGHYTQLGHMKIGDKGRIISLQPGDALYRKRLISMGLLPGTAFTVTQIAPLGDPVQITVRGFSLSLRKKEAAILNIEQVFA